MQRTGRHDWRIAESTRFDLRVRLRSWMVGVQWSDFYVHLRFGPIDLTIDRDPSI